MVISALSLLTPQLKVHREVVVGWTVHRLSVLVGVYSNSLGRMKVMYLILTSLTFVEGSRKP